MTHIHVASIVAYKHSIVLPLPQDVLHRAWPAAAAAPPAGRPGAAAPRLARRQPPAQHQPGAQRAKRLAGIDAAADTVEAAVVAEEKALADRQKQAEENPPATDAPATDNPDAEPLPVPPPRCFGQRDANPAPFANISDST